MVHAPILPCLTQAALIERGLFIWVEDEIILASSKWTNLVGNKVSAVGKHVKPYKLNFGTIFLCMLL